MSATPSTFDWRTWPGGVCASSSAIMPWAQTPPAATPRVLMKSRRVGLMSGCDVWVGEARSTSDGRRDGGHVELLDPHRRNERGASAVVGFARVNRHRLADEREIVVADERGHVPAEVLHRPDDLAVLD